MANTIIVQRDTQLERQRAGFIALSLTNFTNDDEPTIAAGSVVEISGSLYSVTSNQSIAGWGAIANGPVWVKLVPDGTNPFTAEYTSTAPTWFDSKQGWYDGTGTDRYVAGLTKTGASGYELKVILDTTDRGAVLFNNILASGSTPLSRAEIILSGSGNWTVPVGVYRLRITGCGGGGAGGGSTSNGVGAGGGAGATGILYQDVTPGQIIPYSVGSGGVGNTGIGGSGATTTWAGMSCGGGIRGDGGSADIALGRSGGSISGATLGFDGASGMSAKHPMGASGSNSIFGVGGRGGSNNDIGNVGKKGGGGGGAAGPGTNTGGSGGPGFIVIEY